MITAPSDRRDLSLGGCVDVLGIPTANRVAAANISDPVAGS